MKDVVTIPGHRETETTNGFRISSLVAGTWRVRPPITGRIYVEALMAQKKILIRWPTDIERQRDRVNATSSALYCTMSTYVHYTNTLIMRLLENCHFFTTILLSRADWPQANAFAIYLIMTDTRFQAHSLPFVG